MKQKDKIQYWFKNDKNVKQEVWNARIKIAMKLDKWQTKSDSLDGWGAPTLKELEKEGYRVDSKVVDDWLKFQ